MEISQSERKLLVACEKRVRYAKAVRIGTLSVIVFFLAMATFNGWRIHSLASKFNQSSFSFIDPYKANAEVCPSDEIPFRVQAIGYSYLIGMLLTFIVMFLCLLLIHGSQIRVFRLLSKVCMNAPLGDIPSS